jgi:hypothetical protein
MLHAPSHTLSHFCSALPGDLQAIVADILQKSGLPATPHPRTLPHPLTPCHTLSHPPAPCHTLLSATLRSCRRLWPTSCRRVVWLQDTLSLPPTFSHSLSQHSHTVHVCYLVSCRRLLQTSCRRVVWRAPAPPPMAAPTCLSMDTSQSSPLLWLLLSRCMLSTGSAARCSQVGVLCRAVACFGCCRAMLFCGSRQHGVLSRTICSCNLVLHPAPCAVVW